MPTKQCVVLILYIHSIYGILYMYTLSMVVFLKLGERGNGSHSHTFLGSLPLAHNAQDSLVII